jgi:hypothetical protein
MFTQSRRSITTASSEQRTSRAMGTAQAVLGSPHPGVVEARLNHDAAWPETATAHVR